MKHAGNWFIKIKSIIMSTWIPIIRSELCTLVIINHVVSIKLKEKWESEEIFKKNDTLIF